MTAHWDADPKHGEDFWKLGDWDNVHAGQLIAAVWPSGARIGKLNDPGAGTLYLTLNEQGNVSSVEGLKRDGAALFVEAKPEPVLPTEPGLYRLTNNMVVEFTGRHWMSPNHMHYVTTFVEKSATFTRLSPEEDTARKVLEAIRAVARDDGGYYDHQFTAAQLREIGNQFGVQS